MQSATRFSTVEKVILALGGCISFAIELLWLYGIFSQGRQRPDNTSAVFEIIVSLFVAIFLGSSVAFGGILTFRQWTRRRPKAPAELTPVRRLRMLFWALKTPPLTLLFLGLGGWLVGFIGIFLVSSDPPGIIGSVRIPLSDPQGIAIAPSGQIVCYSRFNGRIQIYDAGGRFEKGWFVHPRGKGAHRLVIDDEGRIRLATYGCDWFYDFDGRLVNKREKEHDTNGFDSEFEGFDPVSAEDTQGNQFSYDCLPLWPRVVKIDPGHKKTIVISEPFYLWFVCSPLLSWLTLGLGIVVTGLVDTIEKKYLPER